MEKGAVLDIPKRRAPGLALFMVAVALTLLGLPLSLNADSSIVITDVNAESTCSATLTLNTTSINFPSANPGSVSSVSASQNLGVTANIQIEDSSTVTLTVLAGGDLVSGSGGTIPISAVSWTATGGGDNNGGLLPGTMSKNTQVPAGSWTASGTYSGAFAFYLANSWSYATGTYSQTVTYTITAP